MAEGDGLDVIKVDPLLEPYRDWLAERWRRYNNLKREIERHEGSLIEFSEGFKKYGLLKQPDGSVLYREWAPQAKAVQLIGDFCEWDAQRGIECVRDGFGNWSAVIPPGVLRHGMALKTRLTCPDYSWRDIVPVWIHYAAPTHANSVAYKGIYWDPPPEEKYTFKFPRPPLPKSLRIYEAHVGMSGEEPRIHLYREFADNMIPYIKDVGYNALQLMAIQEHSYYASYGYHVTSMFAVSSRSGTPEDLKYLIDRAHAAGLLVIIDIVHSHASSNIADGPGGIDLGRDDERSYFHHGERGIHTLWGSRCFDYSNWETLRLLLSNIHWWLMEYRFDGLRCDGISSIVFLNHCIIREETYTGHYDDYFNDNIDIEGELYVMLANDLAKQLLPDCVLIAEEVSGMPTLCRPISEGGMGFEYRLGMGFPDKIVELVEWRPNDYAWSMDELVHALCFRRRTEKTIAYLESHDQSLMGDQTVLFRLLKHEMYTGMSVHQKASPRVMRGIALHKMLRLITMALGGEGYMCFMGNEFGHPEWIDFPREDNNNSFDYARRQWSLASAPLLRFRFLLAFDKALMHLDIAYSVLAAEWLCVSIQDDGKMLIVAERGDLVFVFNFHPSVAYTDLQVGVGVPGKYRCVLNTDDNEFGGLGRISGTSEHFTEPGEFMGRPCSMLVYAPPRSAAVYARHQ